MKKKNLIQKKIYVIDHLKEVILGARLPSTLRVLRLLVHRLSANPKKGSSTKALSRTAELIYAGTGDKGRLHSTANGNLCKKKANNTFKGNFQDLFDIAPVDALQKINVEEDK